MSASDKRISELITGHRPTWADIDLGALASNFQIVRKRVGPEIKIMAVVKANAYGHGAVECARQLASEGADWFGVASPEEALELRQSGITQPLLCLGGFWEGQESACIQQALTPVVYRVDMVEALDRAAGDAGIVADVHVKIDTGMGRLGVRFDQAAEFAEALLRFRNIRVDGLMTHFAAADDRSREPLTMNQVKRFEDAVKVFRERGYALSYRHLANSAGIFGESSGWGNLVRPGGVLYGLWRDVLPPLDEQPGFQPVMSLRSRIELVKWVPPGESLGYGCTYVSSRSTLVATLPVGYHDGYMRALSNRGHVIVRGVKAPVIGRISMDFTLIDVTDGTNVAIGDQVTLFGIDGDLVIPVEDLAITVGSLSYELTCRVSQRVPRTYIHA
jgi:alanine racemase